MSTAAQRRAGPEDGKLAHTLKLSHLPSLDGLRAIAAFLVVFMRAGILWCPGGLGVLAFFVLSGFLITWLLLKEEERFGAISIKRFYIRRSLRIFPAFYAYWLLLTAALVLLDKRINWPQAICSFLYVNNYYQAIFGDPNTGYSHTWSLGIEEQFYLLWPVTFLFLKTNRLRGRFLAVGIVAIWVYRELLEFVVHRNQGYIYEAFDARADHLMIGCLLAVALRCNWVPAMWRALCSRAHGVWVTLALLSISSALASRFGTSYRNAVGFIVDPLFVAVLIVQVLSHPSTGFAVALNWRWVRYLGTISYSIYLYQQLVVGTAEKLTAKYPALSMPAIIVAVLAAASVSYWIVEKPFLRLKATWDRPEKLV